MPCRSDGRGALGGRWVEVGQKVGGRWEVGGGRWVMGVDGVVVVLEVVGSGGGGVDGVRVVKGRC